MPDNLLEHRLLIGKWKLTEAKIARILQFKAAPPSESIMGTQPPKIWFIAKFLLFCALGLAVGSTPASAGRHLSGIYRCVSAEVDGRKKPCTAPSLEMNSDGSYRILEEHGTYQILKGGWLVLSAAKNHGKAKLEGSKQIVFEFVSGGKKSKITYRKKFERPDGWVSG